MDVYQSPSQPWDETRHEFNGSYAGPSDIILRAKRIRDYVVDESTNSPKRVCSSSNDSASERLTPHVCSPMIITQVWPPEDDIEIRRNTDHDYKSGGAIEPVSSSLHQLPVEVQVVSMEGVENASGTTESIEQKICYGAVRKTSISHIFSLCSGFLTHFAAM